MNIFKGGTVMAAVAEVFKKEIGDIKIELDNTKRALNEANEKLYEKTWQLEYAYRMLDRIMKREHPDEFSLNLLRNELAGYIK
jgi:hypothetical protein